MSKLFRIKNVSEKTAASLIAFNIKAVLFLQHGDLLLKRGHLRPQGHDRLVEIHLHALRQHALQPAFVLEFYTRDFVFQVELGILHAALQAHVLLVASVQLNAHASEGLCEWEVKMEAFEFHTTITNTALRSRLMVVVEQANSNSLLISNSKKVEFTA